MDRHFTYINIDSPKAYSAPEVSVMTFETEGVLCQSGGAGFGGNNEGYRPGDNGTDFKEHTS